MSSGDDDTEKTFEPSQKKLDDARKKGEIARSTDIQTAAAYLGFAIALSIFGADSISNFGLLLSKLIDQAVEMSDLIFSGGPQATVGGIALGVGKSIAALFVIPMIAVLAVIFIQRGFVFAPSKLEPKWSKISIVSNAKNKFGRKGLFEFAKSFSKLIIYSICLGIFLKIYLPLMIVSISTSAESIVLILSELCIKFLFCIVVISFIIGTVDAFWQHAEHLRKNRMSKKELTDEAKDSEGDPHMKQKRRQRAMEIAHSQMMSDVPSADVIVVNPTHYAVALKWSRAKGSAPVCVAKGVDNVAHRIREVGMEAGVPIQSDPPTARALYATVDLGHEIPPELYSAVAAAIRFSEQIRAKSRKGI